MTLLVLITIFTTVFTMISNLFHLMAWQGIEQPYHHPQRGMDGGMAICVAIMGKIGLCYEHIHS